MRRIKTHLIAFSFVRNFLTIPLTFVSQLSVVKIAAAAVALQCKVEYFLKNLHK